MTGLTYWVWWIAAAVLAGMEILLPGVFLIWLAAAAGVTGLVTLLVEPGWQAQFALFAVLSIVSVVAGRQWFRRHPIASAEPGLNRRGERLIGEVVTVCEAIHDGEGKVMVGDSPWLAIGADAAVGARVRITGVDGATVRVEPA